MRTTEKMAGVNEVLSALKQGSFTSFDELRYKLQAFELVRALSFCKM